MLSLTYLMNTKVQVTKRTTIGESQPFIFSNIVKQGTVLGPVSNNCSVDDFSKSSCPYYFCNTETRSPELVDDIVDLNDGMISAQISCKVMENMQNKKDSLFLLRSVNYWKLIPNPLAMRLA